MFVLYFFHSCRSGSKVFERTGKISQGAEVATISLNTEPNLLITTEDNEDTVLSEPKLSATATINEIFEAMRHPSTGIMFLSKQQSLPSYTFVSYDAINWLNNHIDECNAIDILERMRR